MVVGLLGIDTASLALKEQLLREFSSQSDAVAQLISSSLQSANGNNQWIDRLHQLDQRRSLDWRTTLPNLYQSVQQAGVLK